MSSRDPGGLTEDAQVFFLQSAQRTHKLSLEYAVVRDSNGALHDSERTPGGTPQRFLGDAKTTLLRPQTHIPWGRP